MYIRTNALSVRTIALILKISMWVNVFYNSNMTDNQDTKFHIWYIHAYINHAYEHLIVICEK